MSYLIHNDQLLAVTSENLQSGAWVQVAWHTVLEHINANRDENLLNAFYVKISNAKKWDKYYITTGARSINNSNDEFLLID